MNLKQFTLLIGLLGGWSTSLHGQHDVGTTKADLSVSPTGGALYEIPIAVPPGVRDIVPGVSLVFNSQDGNGLAGWGWNIGGLSTITRVPTTLYHDGEIDGIDFDLKDRYSLDGQRLIVVKGQYGKPNSEYATEVYSNLKVVGYGHPKNGAESGPDHFKVYHADGTVATYRHVIHGDRNWISVKKIFEWVLDTVIDPQGNRIKYYYYGSKQRELLRIKKIVYGGPIDTNHPTNEIEFYYKARKKPEVAYAGGNEIFKRVNLLDRVEVRGGGQLFRKYQLHHQATSLGYEVLTKLQEFNGAGGGLEPITFTYAPETTHNVSNTRNDLTMPNTLHADERALAGDFDGDAKLDFLLYNNKNKNGIELYQKSKGYATPLNQNFAKWNEITTATVLSAQDKVEVKQALFTLRNMNYGKFEFRAYHLGNDGRFARSYTKTWIDTGLSGAKNSSVHKQFVTGDFDGDGLSEGFMIQDKTHAVDLVDIQRNQPSNFVSRAGQLQEKFDRTTGYFRVADFDGDGKADLWHILNSKIRIYTLTKNNQLTLFNEINDGFISVDRPLLIGDYNGDGKSDCLMPEKNGGTRWKYLISRGNYYNDEIKYYKDNCFKRKWRIFPQLKYEKTNGDYEYHYVAQDFNGDGKTDLIKHKIRFRKESSSRYKAEENIQLFVNDGDERLELVEQPGLQKQGYDTKKKGIPLVLDVTCNNGNLEYVYITGRMIQAYEFQKDHRIDVRLDKISHRQVHFELKYDRLEPASTAYMADHSVKYPFVNINTAPDAHLVRQIIQKAPSVERYMDFKYVGAVSHVRGLGFMGFKRREQSNWYGEGVNKIWTITKHDVGRRGAVFESWQALVPGNRPGDPLKQVNYTYQTKLEGGIYINVPTQVVTKDHLTGVNSTETLTYNDYYNPLVTRLQHKDGSTTVTYKYSNNANRKDHQYHVGRVVEKVTQTIVSGSQSTTTETFAYHGGRKINLIKSIARKANGSKPVTEQFTYDNFGNTTSRSISASGAKTRVETFKFSDDGRFLIQKTDIEGSKTSFTYDPITGNPLTSTNHLNQTTVNTYDAWGRALTEVNHYGKETRFEYYYTQWHNLIKIIHHPEGYSERSSYSPMGWERWSSITDFRGKHIFTSFEYDVSGRKVKEGLPRYGEEPQLWNTIAYDLYGRVKEAVSSTGRRMTYTYNGLSVTTHDGVKTITTTKDTNGNTVSVQDAGGTITYSYHASGEVHTTQYDGSTIRTSVDAWGRKTQLVDPSAGTFTYKYDSYGNLVEEISPKGKTITQYDQFGKVRARAMTGDLTNTSETYTYDDKTKLLSNVDASSNGERYTYTYRYDSHYNVDQVIEQNAKATFTRNTTYDGYGRVASETYTSELLGGHRSESGIKNIYKKGQLIELRNLHGNGLLWKLETQNGRKEVTRALLGNGMVQESVYDEFGFLQELLDSKTNGNQQTIALYNIYEFDPQTGRLSNRTNEGLHSWTERFSYDN
ncbi:MAG: FG-GAP-like repeat-containing protein, partial [Bacteroidota bacterium]